MIRYLLLFIFLLLAISSSFLFDYWGFIIDLITQYHTELLDFIEIIENILGVKATSIGDTAAIRITNREYEENRQDELRKIRLLNPVYIDQFVTEFDTLMNEIIL